MKKIIFILISLCFISCYKKDIDALLTQVKILQNRVDSLSNVLSLNTTVLQKRADSLSSALAVNNNILQGLVKSVDSIKTQVQTINVQLTSLNKQLTAVNANVELINSQIKTLTSQYTDLDTKLNNLINLINSYPPYSITQNLVAFYPFSGDAKDKSGSGLDGTVTGAMLTTDRNGNQNSAYSFTNNQQILVLKSADKNLFPMSVSLWYNVDILDTGKSSNVFSKYVSASWYGVQILNGDFRNVSNNGTTEHDGFGIMPWYLKSTSDKLIGYYGEPPFLQKNISKNVWYHFVFTVDSNGGKIYVDGKLVDSKVWTGNPGIANNSYLWKIGGAYDGNWFKGKIDDVGIWGKTLTPDEVSYLYSNQFIK